MPGIGAKIKSFVAKPLFEDLLLCFVILLVGLTSFGLGRLSVREAASPPVVLRTTEGEEVPISLLKDPKVLSAVAPAKQSAAIAGGEGEILGAFMASRNGKKYYPSTCVAAKRILPANRVWFDTREEAEARGYTPAANCP